MRATTSGGPPSVIATVGLHGSASTWAFNVVRELIASACGEAAILPLFADELAQLPPDDARTDRYVVIKSHRGSVELDAWLAAEGAHIVLSVRDPRDACISMCQRFRLNLNRAAAAVAADCRRLARLATLGHKLLRYEDRPFDHIGAVETLAADLGVSPGAAMLSEIFERYRTDAVRAFAARLTELPADRLTATGGFAMDQVTQILAPHIGDAATGKWRRLPPKVAEDLTHFFGPFLDDFGYAR